MKNVDLSHLKSFQVQPCRKACCAAVVEDAGTSEFGFRGTVVGEIVDLRDHSSVHRQKEDKVKGDVDSREGFRKEVFLVSGMDCGDCAAKLERRLAAVPRVRSAAVSFAVGKLTIEHALADADIIRLVQQAGFRAVKEEKTRRPTVKSSWWKNARTLATFGSGILLAVATGMDWTSTAAEYTDYLFGLAAIVGGFHAARSGLYGLKSLTFDMNFLMTAAIIGAAAIGEWNEGGVTGMVTN